RRAVPAGAAESLTRPPPGPAARHRPGRRRDGGAVLPLGPRSVPRTGAALPPATRGARRRADHHGAGEERVRREEPAALAPARLRAGANRAAGPADPVHGAVACTVAGRVAGRLLPVPQPGVPELLLPVRVPDVVGAGRLVRARRRRFVGSRNDESLTHPLPH